MDSDLTFAFDWISGLDLQTWQLYLFKRHLIHLVSDAVSWADKTDRNHLLLCTTVAHIETNKFSDIGLSRSRSWSVLAVYRDIHVQLFAGAHHVCLQSCRYVNTWDCKSMLVGKEIMCMLRVIDAHDAWPVDLLVFMPKLFAGECLDANYFCMWVVKPFFITPAACRPKHHNIFGASVQACPNEVFATVTATPGKWHYYDTNSLEFMIAAPSF